MGISRDFNRGKFEGFRSWKIRGISIVGNSRDFNRGKNQSQHLQFIRFVDRISFTEKFNQGTQMSHSLSKVILHIIFRIKTENSAIPSHHLPGLFTYIGGVLNNHKSVSFRVGGVSDHIHIACSLPRTISTSDLVKEIKGSTSRWISKRGLVNDFSWQVGYGVFSLSQSHLEQLVHYIDNQEQHHRYECYDEELKTLIRRYKLDSNN